MHGRADVRLLHRRDATDARGDRQPPCARGDRLSRGRLRDLSRQHGGGAFGICCSRAGGAAHALERRFLDRAHRCLERSPGYSDVLHGAAGQRGLPGHGDRGAQRLRAGAAGGLQAVAGRERFHSARLYAGHGHGIAGHCAHRGRNPRAKRAGTGPDAAGLRDCDGSDGDHRRQRHSRGDFATVATERRRYIDVDRRNGQQHSSGQRAAVFEHLQQHAFCEQPGRAVLCDLGDDRFRKRQHAHYVGPAVAVRIHAGSKQRVPVCLPHQGRALRRERSMAGNVRVDNALEHSARRSLSRRGLEVAVHLGQSHRQSRQFVFGPQSHVLERQSRSGDAAMGRHDRRGHGRHLRDCVGHRVEPRALRAHGEDLAVDDGIKRN